MSEIERAPRTFSLARGTTIPGTPFVVQRPLSGGGMGAVLVVRDARRGDRCALKVLRAELASRLDLAHRLREEARLLLQLESPHLVEVRHIGALPDGRPYFVMELLDGDNLAHELRRFGVFAVPTALDLARQALTGLMAAHAHDVVHRDVKLENLVLQRDGVLKVVDFGIARVLGEATRITGPGLSIGTPRTMSPEQFYGGDVDARSDVYAVGLALYELLVGRGPFDELRDVTGLSRAHQSRAVPAPSTRAPQPIPPLVDGLVGRALAKRPDDRFPSAGAMLVAVTEVMRELERKVEAHRALSRHREDEMSSTRRTLATVLAGLMVVGAVGCGGSAQRASFGSPSAPQGGPQGAPAAQPAGGGFFDDSPAPAPESPAAQSRELDGEESIADADERPGLGTEWGESRFSRISSAPFHRADASSPFVTASLFYNDQRGVQAMADRLGLSRNREGLFRVQGGTLSFGLRDGSGRFMPGFIASDDKRFVMGEDGDRYTIVVRNHSDMRFEVVLSVDGLDVLDGKAASFRKRGYLIEPFGELEVEGFRQSVESVAAFRFGAVDESYAERRHGDTRNVGVIGLAAFHERGDDPFGWTGFEVDRRRNANPFPGQFATPPR